MCTFGCIYVRRTYYNGKKVVALYVIRCIFYDISRVRKFHLYCTRINVSVSFVSTLAIAIINVGS